MALAEDLTLFFADFGVTATPSVGAPITVIFDQAYIASLGGAVSATGPVAKACGADVAAFVPNSTTMAIGGVTYTVRDIQPDGTGLSDIVLEAA